jgi:hypothetical protein
LDSFKISKDHLNNEDIKCLLDHLSKESCQLLRKSDRCTLLLNIINTDESFNNDKYTDQLIGLLLQLPQQEDEIKFQLSYQVMEIIMKRRRIKQGSGSGSGNEEIIYQWMKLFVEKHPEKEIQFYSIKIKYEENDNGEDVKRSQDETDRADGSNYENVMLEDDLQKLKIFESFQM